MLLPYILGCDWGNFSPQPFWRGLCRLAQPQHPHVWSLPLCLAQEPRILGEPGDPPSNKLHKCTGHETDTTHSLDATILLLGFLPYSLFGPVHLPSWVTSEEAAMSAGMNKPGTNGPNRLVWSRGSREESR